MHISVGGNPMKPGNLCYSVMNAATFFLQHLNIPWHFRLPISKFKDRGQLIFDLREEELGFYHSMTILLVRYLITTATGQKQALWIPTSLSYNYAHEDCSEENSHCIYCNKILYPEADTCSWEGFIVHRRVFVIEKVWWDSLRDHLLIASFSELTNPPSIEDWQNNFWDMPEFTIIF